MELLWIFMCFFFYSSSAITLEDIANTLNKVETLLNKNDKEECSHECSDIQALKSELKDYVDDRCGKCSGNGLSLSHESVSKTEIIDLSELEKFVEDRLLKYSAEESQVQMLLHAFSAEKQLRLEMSQRIKTLTDERVKDRTSIDRLKNELLKLDQKTEAVQQSLHSMENDIHDLGSNMIKEVQLNKWKTENQALCSSEITQLNASIKNDFKNFQIELNEVKIGKHTRKIAFSAKIAYGKSYSDIEPGQTVVFGNVILNAGHAYSRTSGIFTAPVDGVYVFHVHITGSDNRGLEIVMRKNDASIMLLYVRGPSHGTDSGEMAIQLKKNDVVKVAKYGHYGGRPFYIHHVFSSFSGFLLYEL